MAPIREAFAQGQQLTQEQKDVVNKFFEPLCEAQLLEELQKAFWSQSKDEIDALLKQGYANLQCTFIMPTIQTLQRKQSSIVLFQQVFQSQVLNAQFAQLPDQVKKDKILNAIDGFVTDLVKAEFSFDVKAKLKAIHFEKLQQLQDYEELRKLLQTLKTEVEDDRNSKRVLMSRSSKSWICGRKHRIVYYRTGFKRLN